MAPPSRSPRVAEESRRQRRRQAQRVGLDLPEVGIAPGEHGERDGLLGARLDRDIVEQGPQVGGRQQDGEPEDLLAIRSLEHRDLLVPGGAKGLLEAHPVHLAERAILHEDPFAKDACPLVGLEQGGPDGVGVGERAYRVVLERRAAQQDGQPGGGKENEQRLPDLAGHGGPQRGDAGARCTFSNRRLVCSESVSRSIDTTSSRSSKRQPDGLEEGQIRGGARGGDDRSLPVGELEVALDRREVEREERPDEPHQAGHPRVPTCGPQVAPCPPRSGDGDGPTLQHDRGLHRGHGFPDDPLGRVAKPDPALQRSGPVPSFLALRHVRRQLLDGTVSRAQGLRRDLRRRGGEKRDGDPEVVHARPGVAEPGPGARRRSRMAGGVARQSSPASLTVTRTVEPSAQTCSEGRMRSW